MKPTSLIVTMLGAGALLLGSRLLSVAQEAEPGEPGRSFRHSSGLREEGEENAKRRLREGTALLDKGGHFRQDGDGAIFVTEDQYELHVLENLNLERVVRTLKASDVAESIRWSVSGVVTEFNGRNFLLISRAVYKSASPPPVPDQILH